MFRRRFTVRALGAGALAVLLFAPAVLLLGRLAAREPHAGPVGVPGHGGGAVQLTVPKGGHVLVALPTGWGLSRRDPGFLTLASPRTCHTATLSAFVDHTAESPERRGIRLLGYLSGRAFDLNRLWRGTTAGGRGYAVYDPEQLVGVEVVRAEPRPTVVVVHGLPTHRRCSRAAAAAPQRELSQLLEDLDVLTRRPHAARTTAAPSA